jgi:hypothetical protein
LDWGEGEELRPFEIQQAGNFGVGLALPYGMAARDREELAAK